MANHIEKVAAQFLNKGLDDLSAAEERVLRLFLDRKPATRDTQEVYENQLTFGQRLADRVAAVGGSWTFIISFCAVMLVWVSLNSFFLARSGKDFDPYPYILLNLVLSMVASMQAPVIMMSQNRQATKDRLDATHDYEVNLKAEMEILELHRKVDTLREQQWSELITFQQEQIQLLTEIVQKQGNALAGGATQAATEA
jgi:uncharacterized membrane protein